MSDKYKGLTYSSRPWGFNNFSYWFPKIQNCGMNVPESIIIPVPKDMLSDNTFYLYDSKKDMVRIEKFVREDIVPVLEKHYWEHYMLFVRNGCFSGKFNANDNCFVTNDVYSLVKNIANIQYDSLTYETGGESEIVIRKRIFDNNVIIPRIYNGLPLRPEFRIFYDFDLKEVIFAVNYWDFDYRMAEIYDATDRIVFQRMKGFVNETYDVYKSIVSLMVAEAMENVRGLSGPWSIDVMMSSYPETIQRDIIEMNHLKYEQVEVPQFYLIDMAVAEKSAYWENRPGRENNENKVG